MGKLNRHTFLAFLWLELYALLSSLGCAIFAARAYVTAGFWSDRLGWVIGFVIIDAFVAISVSVLAAAQASQVARNVTTNELANWHRRAARARGARAPWRLSHRNGAPSCCPLPAAPPRSRAASFHTPDPSLAPQVQVPPGLHWALPQPLQPRVLPQLRGRLCAGGLPRGARAAAARPRRNRGAGPHAAAARVSARPPPAAPR